MSPDIELNDSDSDTKRSARGPPKPCKTIQNPDSRPHTPNFPKPRNTKCELQPLLSREAWMSKGAPTEGKASTFHWLS